ncbi:hypothetical protein GXW83_16560 [Streptacidiphilus sp. PB12-B1b]|uniref:hypothetical protein n=1 Tax=Streptacidiphilus sp. PB12-B1b TaxID=2705012 RepID=UPI0015FDF7D7|nr:hypothetical protein [Streptacidiphilus sp. PB12-B1b]QMU77080.1 hypothetical protein GXW83_16560 [Streptacidiphilus sp. PB12-B1b]
MSGFRVTTTVEVSKELGAYGPERQPLIQAALEMLSDESAMAAGTADGPGRYAELLPGTTFYWLVLERPRLVVVWQVATAV